MENEVFDQGRMAYRMEKPISANPYPEAAILWRNWNRGWLSSEAAHLQGNAIRTSDMMTLNERARLTHKANRKWWVDPVTGEPVIRNKGELLMLMVSEIAEAMEGERKDLMDDKLPHRRMAEVELADALIRIFDYAWAFNYDLDGAVREKMAFNATRHDHSHEARLAPGGKKW